MRTMWDDFRQFAFKGNVINLAVGVMIGTAFGAIVSSLVNDLFMPLLSLLTGRIDFTNLMIKLGTSDHAASINYGSFLQAVVNFLMITASVFLFVRLISRFKKHEEPADTRKCPYCIEPVADEATRCPHCTAEI